MDSVQTVVIGAGVIGLAIARELALSGREVVVLERENAFGTVTSARNSEVIHAGIYYEPGSMKARVCVDGRQRLVEFCRTHGVGHRICGKLIVAASDAERAGLEKIERRAQAAGVHSLRWLDGAEARSLEPALSCRHALLSPETGIVDSHGLMLALLGEAEGRGAMLALLSEVVRGEVRADGFELEVAGEAGPMRLRCRELVNAAGLGAQRVASRIEGLAAGSVPPLHLAKGNYFSLSGRCPFSRLIYPIPNEAGLGVHLTLDLGGQGRFGPDVEWVSEIGYEVDPRRGDSFYAEIRTYWAGLPDGALQPAYAGMRAKLVGPDAPAADFRIDGTPIHGAPGLVNLFGIESPGL
ncbi:MAG: NAD(P)/FAD-dependent oxidoreductase, partial [Burkholderiales bacterium]